MRDRVARILFRSGPCCWIDVIGRSAAPELYLKTIPSDFALLHRGQVWCFYQVWTIFDYHLSNVPYWSLNYRVWYYVLFGIYCFVAPGGAGC